MNKQALFIQACNNSDVGLVRGLINDPAVNPNVADGWVLKRATDVEIIELLLQRMEPTVELIDNVLYSDRLLKIYLADGRVLPSEYAMYFVENPKSIELLLNDDRITYVNSKWIDYIRTPEVMNKYTIKSYNVDSPKYIEFRDLFYQTMFSGLDVL